MIPFTKPTFSGQEEVYIAKAIRTNHLSGDGPYTQKCHKWFENKLRCKKALLTPSCTAALEMAAILINIQPGDEVIMPSYTFVSTANAFVLRGAKIVFVDIRPDTMNIDETLIESAITSKTRAIVPVHYAGVACEMDTIMGIANTHNLFVIEDAAQGMMSTYKGRVLGTIGHIGTYSFHATKNYTSGGEGGLLIINDSKLIKRAEVIREKGTDRTQFINGNVDKYSWKDVGSSYLLSEIQSAFLYSQLKKSQFINEERLMLWSLYQKHLSPLESEKLISLPFVPPNIGHNGHIFYLRLESSKTRNSLMDFLKDKGVQATSHYLPLHESDFGKTISQFVGDDKYTTSESKKILRLPLFYGLTPDEVKCVCKLVVDFFKL